MSKPAKRARSEPPAATGSGEHKHRRGHSKASAESKLEYCHGFDNEHSTEALVGALPVGQNTPQKCPYGLYAEQLSGTAFTKPRADNRKTWLYRIRPSALHPPMKPFTKNNFVVANFSDQKINPNQLRWKPTPIPKGKVDFVEGLRTVAGAGSAESKSGLAIHIYAFTASMGKRVMVNSDGDFLIVPEMGDLFVRTEMGNLEVPTGMFCVVPRGVRFSVDATDDAPRRGYICEIFEGHYQLPELGPIGANGLANPMDFQYPTACYEDCEDEYEMVYKFAGALFHYQQPHSPFDVVAWRGNYAPYRYDMERYCVINSVLYDHIDPCIFTVLTCQTMDPGVACADFVIFPPRYAVQEKTFRPPYYHRNCMSEYMGNIRGAYDAKPDFQPGASTLHSCMVGHGPSAAVFEGASNAELKPDKMPEGDLSFMFESTYILRLTDYAENLQEKDDNYFKVWQGLKSHFDPTNVDGK